MSLLLTAGLDTICKVVFAKDSLVVVQEPEPFFYFNISTGDILTIVGMVCSVGVFCWQLCQSRKEYKENLRSIWFLQVIVQPSMKEISEFYDKVITDTDNNKKALSAKFNNGESAKDVSTDLARCKRSLKNEVKTSLGGFQCLLKASEPDVADEIDSILDNLVDVVTRVIDGYESYSDGQTCKVEVLANKQEFLSKIYSAWNN